MVSEQHEHLGMVSQVQADAGQIVVHRHVHLLQVGGGPYSGK